MTEVIYNLLYAFCFGYWIFAGTKAVYLFNSKKIAKNDTLIDRLAMNGGILLYILIHVSFLYRAYFKSNLLSLSSEIILSTLMLILAIVKVKTIKKHYLITAFLCIVELILLIGGINSVR